MEELTLASSVFKEGETIPSKYTCDSEDISPPLSISGVSPDAKSLVIMMDDPDIPDVVKKSRLIEKFDHWALFNLPPDLREMEEYYQGVGVEGNNTRGEVGYSGPCPPSEHEPSEHRYFFQLYSLDTMLELSEGATYEEVKNAMKGHILQKAELMGRYKRVK